MYRVHLARATGGMQRYRRSPYQFCKVDVRNNSFPVRRAQILTELKGRTMARAGGNGASRANVSPFIHVSTKRNKSCASVLYAIYRNRGKKEREKESKHTSPTGTGEARVSTYFYASLKKLSFSRQSNTKIRRRPSRLLYE